MAAASEEAQTSDGRKPPALRALVVDDHSQVRRMIKAVAEGEGWEVAEAGSLGAARALLAGREFHIIFLDKFIGPAENGVEFFRQLRREGVAASVVIITGEGDLHEALGALTDGAAEYLAKPLTAEQVAVQLDEARRRFAPPGGLEVITPLEYQEHGLVGRSASMTKVVSTIYRVAKTGTSIFITGATGTGKEVVAKEAHRLSRRAGKSFVTVNCGAIPEELIESELFGHTKGSFTGAHADRVGLFEEAHGGTIFLDEITETRQSFQVKLLRALQERQIRRVGSNRYVDVDVRVIAATNKDIRAEVETGRFRSDLYYRLNQCLIHIPPLGERRNDIEPLVRQFLGRHNVLHGRAVGCALSLIEELEGYDWPGNVRELEQAVVGAAEVCKVDGGGRGQIRVADFRDEIRAALGRLKETDARPPAGEEEDGDYRTLEAVEMAHIERALRETEGNKTRAAKLLGIPRRTLLRRLERAGAAAG